MSVGRQSHRYLSPGTISWWETQMPMPLGIMTIRIPSWTDWPLGGSAEKTAHRQLARRGLSLALAALSCGGTLALVSAQPREEAFFRGDETALMRAAAHGQVAAMRQLLTRGAAVDARNGAGMTALILAAWSGQEEAVGVLLDAGADPNAMSRTGEAALIQVVWSGDLPTIRALVTRGAKVNSVDRYNGTALQLAAARGNEAATRLLLGAGADVARGG
jgi:ankyrin repeat protein